MKAHEICPRGEVGSSPAHMLRAPFQALRATLRTQAGRGAVKNQMHVLCAVVQGAATLLAPFVAPTVVVVLLEFPIAGRG
eukprot:CAMPEP_0206504610 /NCGR_PEP_ID=MMETSP0324_2-20121206/55600_1 /ASSEMBLY_ACC=CAM_ASM_000836 /TAXON_ID=2866 /ORGANISM="Crypthecodinium cohnii, Strain Seligo" /LENGTH=79 /DNA_ID=CAMNT_0053993837 /DNA_START=218 /DNA_END=453 /DNA_ORIENTATION=+